MKDKMKVLHVISGGDSGGAKTSVFTLLSGLKDEINIKLICFIEGEFSKEARALGIDTVVLQQKSRIDLTVLKRLVDIANEEHYQIVNCHGARANFLVSTIKKKIKGKVITTIHSDYLHDFDNDIYKKTVFTLLNKMSLKAFDGYIAMAEDFEKFMLERGFNNIHIAYNGIVVKDYSEALSREAFCARFDIPYDEKDFYVGSATRLHPIKGIDVMLKAAKIIKKKNKHIKFLIAGMGEEKYTKTYKEYIEKNDLQDTVYLLGFVQAIDTFFSQIDINAISSHSEAVCYALLEGAKFSNPTIASNIGGNKELICSRQYGLLFEDNDSKMFSKHILSVYNSEDKGKAIGEKLNQRVMNHFTKAAMVRRYIEIYNTFLNNRKHTEKVNNSRVLVSGYYGYSNSGDDAILASICQDLKGISKNIEPTILSYKPEQTKKDYKVNAINKFDFIKVIRGINQTDMLLMGGGTLLQDESSSRSLYYYLFLLWYASIRGKKILLYGNGIGPVTKRGNRWLTKRIANQVDIITLREKMSYKELKKLGVVKPEIHITADPVFSYVQEATVDMNKIFENNQAKVEGKYCVVLFRKWRGVEVFVPKIAKLCDYIYEQYGLSIVLVPMKYPADLSICEWINSEMENEGIIFNQKFEVKELVEIIGQAYFVLSMRLHSLLYAALKGVPMIGFSYTHKLKYYMEELSIPYVEEFESFDVSEVKEMIDDIMCCYDAYRQSISANVDEIKRRAVNNRKYLIKLLKDNTK